MTPVEGSWELNSADRIEVPIRNAHPSPEPEIGDVIEIEYSGEILETYPARIADVYGIKVIKETETWDLIPMVMVNGILYLDTGHESKIEARCGVMDGEITSQVDGNKQPSVDNQSNFGTGYVLDQLHGNTLNRQTLYDALLATAKKRGTERHLAEAVDILNEVESSPVMQKLWESYRRKFSYAADLEWSIIMGAVRSLYALCEKRSSL